MAGDPSTVSPAERGLSALVGYTAGAVVVLPFDRVKSLMQVSGTARRTGAIPLARSIVAWPQRDSDPQPSAFASGAHRRIRPGV